MPGRAAVVAPILLVGMAAAAAAQSTVEPPSPFDAGRAALAGHDPTAAVRHFQQVDTPEGLEWLAVALMMESRSPSDAYVERAYEAARRSRVTAPGPTAPQQTRSRANAATALQPGDLVIAFLVGEAHAYAWAFDRGAFIGYPLPAPSEITTAVERAIAYIDRGDRDGLKRITDDLLPALFGPATERLPTLTRLILVVDGPLRKLPFDDVNIGGLTDIQTAEFGSLDDAIARARSAPVARRPLLQMGALAALLAIVVIAGVAAIRRR